MLPEALGDDIATNQNFHLFLTVFLNYLYKKTFITGSQINSMAISSDKNSKADCLSKRQPEFMATTVKI